MRKTRKLGLLYSAPYHFLNSLEIPTACPIWPFLLLFSGSSLFCFIKEKGKKYFINREDEDTERWVLVYLQKIRKKIFIIFLAPPRCKELDSLICVVPTQNILWLDASKCHCFLICKPVSCNVSFCCRKPMGTLAQTSNSCARKQPWDQWGKFSMPLKTINQVHSSSWRMGSGKCWATAPSLEILNSSRWSSVICLEKF